MYARLTRSRIRVDLASPPTLVKNYLNSYFAMYKHPTYSRVQVELATPPTWVWNYLNSYCS